MKIFDLFKRKKDKVETNDNANKEVEHEKIELTPDVFHSVQEQQFKEELNKYFDLKKYGFGISPDEKIRIFCGDVYDLNAIDFSGHILIIGNLTTTWVNLTTNAQSGGGGSLFVTGNINVDYFSSDFSRFVMINGSLIVNKIINAEFEDSCTIVHGDFITEYYHGIDIWTEVNGRIEIEYGWGYCTNKNSESVFPKNDLETSLKFLNVDHTCNSEKINSIIKMKMSNTESSSSQT